MAIKLFFVASHQFPHHFVSETCDMNKYTLYKHPTTPTPHIANKL